VEAEEIALRQPSGFYDFVVFDLLFYNSGRSIAIVLLINSLLSL
jgi:hypothetical protein